MTDILLPYGTTSLTFSPPEGVETVVLEPGEVPGLDDPVIAAGMELHRSAGLLAPPRDNPARRVAVAVNDKTRPVPHEVLIPPLLEELRNAGWKSDEITFIIAVGAHAPMTPDEFSMVLPGDMAAGCRIISHDPDDPAGLVDLGATAAGTPCRGNRVFMEADLRIVVGNIEPHQFAGWSGGAKSAAIGLSARETIAANHSMMVHPGAAPCRFGDNPVRQDVEQIGRLMDVHMALNAVMNGNRDVMAVLAGTPGDVMTRGIAVAETYFTVPFDRPADLVIVSAGGHPKDINLYQAQKALRNGAKAAAPGAPVIVVAACPEGVGSRLLENWMADKDTHEDVRRAFRDEEFRLGHHKGMLLSADTEGREVFLVSGLGEEEVRNLLLTPVPGLEEGLERASPPSGGRIAVIPHGGSVVPISGRT